MISVQKDYEFRLEQLASEIRTIITNAAAQTGLPYETLVKSVITMLDTTGRDGRALQWRVRLRLYDAADGYVNVIADSDDGVPHDQMGATVIHGLPAVASWIAELSAAHHKAPCAGLDSASLRRKLASLRTQLSYRKDGTGTLRAEYQVMSGERLRYMVARCDVERVDPSQPIGDGQRR